MLLKRLSNKYNFLTFSLSLNAMQHNAVEGQKWLLNIFISKD